MGKYSAKSTIGWSPGVTPGKYSLTAADAAAVASAAQQLGITPGQLMGIIANETSYKGNPDTLNPGIYGGYDFTSDADSRGDFFGLVQWSPTNVVTYGIDTENPNYANQMAALVAYALDNGFVPGEMDAGHLYNAILSGEATSSLSKKSGDKTVAQWMGIAADKAKAYEGYIAARIGNPQMAAMARGMEATDGNAALADGVISHLSANPTAAEIGQFTAIANALAGNLGQPIGDIGSLADSAISGMAISGLPAAMLGSSDGAYAISPDKGVTVNSTYGNPQLGSLGTFFGGYEAAMGEAPFGPSATADSAPAPSQAISNGISGLYSAQTAYAPALSVPPGPYGSEGLVNAALAGDANGVAAALAAVKSNAESSVGLMGKLAALAAAGGDKAKAEATITAQKMGEVAAYFSSLSPTVLGTIANNAKNNPALLSSLPAQAALSLSAFTTNGSAASSLKGAMNAEGTAKALAALSSPTPTNAGISKGMSGLASAGAYGISPGSIGSGMSGLASAGAGYASSPSSPASVSAGMSGLASAGAGPSPSSVSAGMSGLASAGKSTSAPSSSPSISSGMSGLASAGAPTSLGPVSYSTPTTGSSASSAQGAQAMSSPAAMAALSGLTGNNGITTATPTTMASLSQAATTLGDVGDLTGFIAPAAVVAPAAKTTTAKAVPAAKSKTSTTVAAKTKTPAQSLYGQAVANSVANGYGTPASFGPGTMYGVSPSGQPYSSIGNAYGGTTTSWGTSGGGTATAVGYASQRGGDQGQAVPAAVASGSSAGAKVLCTHYKDKGWLPRDIWVADIRYSLMAPMDMRIGYLSWAMPLVDYLKTGTRTARIAERILWPVVRAWSQEMAHRGDPRFEGSFWGRIVLHTFGSVCLVIGRNIRRKWIGETVNG